MSWFVPLTCKTAHVKSYTEHVHALDLTVYQDMLRAEVKEFLALPSLTAYGTVLNKSLDLLITLQA